MPTYDYACRDCKKKFVIFLTFKEQETGPKVTCPHCGCSKVEKIFSAFFAKTDRKS